MVIGVGGIDHRFLDRQRVSDVVEDPFCGGKSRRFSTQFDFWRFWLVDIGGRRDRSALDVVQRPQSQAVVDWNNFDGNWCWIGRPEPHDHDTKTSFSSDVG